MHALLFLMRFALDGFPIWGTPANLLSLTHIVVGSRKSLASASPSPNPRAGLFDVVCSVGSDRYLAMGRLLLDYGTAEVNNVISRYGNVVSDYDKLHVLLEEWEKQKGVEATDEKLMAICDQLKIKGAVEMKRK